MSEQQEWRKAAVDWQERALKAEAALVQVQQQIQEERGEVLNALVQLHGAAQRRQMPSAHQERLYIRALSLVRGSE